MHTVCIRQKRSKGNFANFFLITNYEHNFLAKINWAQKHTISGNFGATSRKVRRNLRKILMYPWCNLRVI